MSKLEEVKEEKVDVKLNVYQKLNKVQTELKAPKGQFNKFGNYKYRSCEDILEGLKPLLKEVGAIVLLSDSVEFVEGRYYVKARAQFVDTDTAEKIEVSAMAREDDSKKGMDSSQLTGSTSSYARKYRLNGLFCIDDNTAEKIEVSAMAREDDSKKGMDSSQLTGSTSSYARKYRLNGLFCIDDKKDSDATNDHAQGTTQAQKGSNDYVINQNQLKRLYAIASGKGVNSETVKRQVMSKFGKEPKDLSKSEYDRVCQGYEKMANKE